MRNLACFLAATMISFAAFPEELLSWEKVEAAASQRAQVVKSCLAVLRSREITAIGRWTRAVEILSEFGAKEATPVILEMIDKFDGDEIGLNVAQRALIKMGRDVVAPCLRELSKKEIEAKNVGPIIRVLEMVEPNKKVIKAIIEEMPQEQQEHLNLILTPFLNRKWGHNFDG